VNEIANCKSAIANFKFEVVALQTIHASHRFDCMWIKICGVRDVETAQAAAAAGADAVGLNFYDESPRALKPAIAASIVAGLRAAWPSVEPVGVFVNHSVEAIREICRECKLRTVQLHGDEAPEQVAQLAADYRVIRAFRVGDEGLGTVARYLEACTRLRAIPWACLVDGKAEGSFGGTGKSTPWDALRRLYRSPQWPPLILAGGLTVKNVAEAIRVVAPWGVDVASGVESSIACKDSALVRQFVQNARAPL
jgi:phosphoribosylanthranilate isomerase